MMVAQSIEFDHEDRREIYDYVESRGTVPKSELLVGPPEQRRPVAHHVAILKRDGFLQETEDGQLRIALEGGEQEEFSADEFDFTIRSARQKDLSGIVGAIRQVTEEMTYIVAESVADELDHENVLLRRNELESRIFFAATVNDEVIGWAHVYAPELEKLSHTAELTVGVLEGYRGRGIGSHLLQRALEWTASNGYEKLYQSVPSTNEDAIAFFEERGWEVEAVRANHYKLGDEYVDEVMMALQL